MFDVAPRDPGFMDPTAWTAVGDGVKVNAAASGTVDPGQAEITANGMCAGSSLSQTFLMPPLAKAEPFKASITYSIVNPKINILIGSGLSGVLSVEVGGRFFENPASTTVRTDSFCLGAKDYGRPIDFRVMTRGGPVMCPSNIPGSLSIDQFIVQPVTTDECPMPGTITNGDFEGTTGWQLAAQEGATAAIVGGVGESSSRAAQLGTTTRCSQASMTGMLAIPEQIATPAIDLFYSYAYSGTFGGRLTVSFDGKNISVLPAKLSAGHAHICLPAWTLGTTGTIGFLLQHDAEGAGLNDDACATSLSRTFTVDSIKLVSDATCGATTDNGDGGFERTTNINGPMVGWGLVDGFSGDIRGATAVIDSDAVNAHTGKGVLQLGASSACIIDAGADLSFMVPPLQGSAGPALKLFANVSGNVNSETVVNIPPEVRFVIPSQTGYVQRIVCIPKRLANRLVTARIATLGLGSSCTPPFTEEHSFIDDVEITADPACTLE